MENHTSVSYTHLDVYKRQEQPRISCSVERLLIRLIHKCLQQFILSHTKIACGKGVIAASFTDPR